LVALLHKLEFDGVMLIFNKVKEAPLSSIRKKFQNCEYSLRVQRIIVCIGVRLGFNATFTVFRTSVLLFRSNIIMNIIIMSIVVMSIIYVTNLNECKQIIPSGCF